MALRAAIPFLLVALAFAGVSTLSGNPAVTEPGQLPPFPEVFRLVRTNLAGETEASLNRLAVQGFLRELAPRVSVVESEAEAAEPRTNRVEGAGLLRGKVAYLRLGVVGEGLAEAVQDEFQRLSASNGLNGLILDLRCVGGDNYPAAVAVADLFLEQEVPLINWGEGLKRSTDKARAITLPTAVLINRETGAAAEALAGMLRQTGAALLFGSPSAGTAGLTREFPFADGQRLRIVVSQVQLGDARPIANVGLRPDVEVPFDLEQERALLAEPVTRLTRTASAADVAGSNGSRLRMDEADLVRRWRGEALTAEDLVKPLMGKGPEARDPVLLRALDLMEGLAILRQAPTR